MQLMFIIKQISRFESNDEVLVSNWFIAVLFIDELNSTG